MRLVVRSSLAVFLVATFSAGLSCSSPSDDESRIPIPPSTGGGSSGSGGRGSSAGGNSGGSTAGSSGGTAGATGGGAMAGAAGGMGGAGGGEPATDAAGPDPGDPDAGSAMDSAPPASNDWMGYTGVRDLSQVNPTEGCGKAPDIQPSQWVARMINNIPVPEGQRDNPGDGNRKYFVRLPPNYDNNKKYKLVIAASSCTGGNQNLAAMGDVDDVTDDAGGAVLISPVVEPGVWDPDQCYDDKDPNSIEHPFLERFLDEVGQAYCYDKNKVFVQGHSSGGWYSNMVGCVHASERIRAMSSNGGGIPDNTSERPKCTDKPMPGLWIHPQQDSEQPNATRRAISRALVVNKCEGAGTNPMDESVWENAPSMPWNEAGGVNCRKYMCPAAFPVIFCRPPGGHGPVNWHTEAAWAMFNSLP